MEGLLDCTSRRSENCCPHDPNVADLHSLWIISSIGNTYFIEQANNMDRRIGKWEAPITVEWQQNVLSVYVVGKVSEKVGGKRNWFQYTFNMSRLDRYYWVLAVLCSLNLIVFVVVALIHRYKNWNLENRETVDTENAGVEMGDPEEAQKCSCFC